MKRRKIFRSTLALTIGVMAVALLLIGQVVLAQEGAELELEKMVDTEAYVVPGSVVTYTIMVSNASTETEAMTVTLTDELPQGVRFGGWVTEAPSGTMMEDHTLSWTGDITAEGELTWQFTAMLEVGTVWFGDTVTNTAELTATGLAAALSDAAVVDVVETPVMIEKTVTPETAEPGDVVLYTLMVSNMSKGPLTGVLTDTFPYQVLEFGGWVDPMMPMPEPNAYGVITMSGTFPAEQTTTSSYTATLLAEGTEVSGPEGSFTVVYPANRTVTNTFEFQTGQWYDSVDAAFTIKGEEEEYYIYLPVIMRNYAPNAR